jgi:hypothetical protein
MSRHPVYRPIVGQVVLLTMEKQVWRQKSTPIHWGLSPYTMDGGSDGNLVGIVSAGTPVRVLKFQRRTYFLGVPTDFAVVQMPVPGYGEDVQADVRVAMPSVADKGEPWFPWRQMAE